MRLGLLGDHPEHPADHARLSHSIWAVRFASHAREQIGQNLRERYESSTELPLTLLRLVRKLDVLEGNQLLKGFSQRLRDQGTFSR